VHLWFGCLICHKSSLIDSGCRHTTSPSLSRIATQRSEGIMTWDTYVLSNVRQFHARVTAGVLSVICGAGDFGKIWSACGQHENQ